MNCSICPRHCNVDRSKSLGYCRSNNSFKIARAALHYWEEPCLSGQNGSGAVFFSGCNLRCAYCQNYEISHELKGVEITEAKLIEIFENLIEQGANNINLVTIMLGINDYLSLEVIGTTDSTEKDGTISGNMKCDERIIEPLTQMFAAAKEDGINLVVCSPYRDLERQEFLFERKVKSYQHSGMSYMDAYKKASVTVTLPGASEHQIGLAVDIISDTYTSLNEGFADTDAGKWLAEHSWEYGFILRYPLGKEEITGIQYEPWHFRYVGTDAAEVITNQNITLEEFVENL